MTNLYFKIRSSDPDAVNGISSHRGMSATRQRLQLVLSLRRANRICWRCAAGIRQQSTSAQIDRLYSPSNYAINCDQPLDQSKKCQHPINGIDGLLGRSLHICEQKRVGPEVSQSGLRDGTAAEQAKMKGIRIYDPVVESKQYLSRKSSQEVHVEDEKISQIDPSTRIQKSTVGVILRKYIFRGFTSLRTLPFRRATCPSSTTKIVKYMSSGIPEPIRPGARLGPDSKPFKYEKSPNRKPGAYRYIRNRGLANVDMIPKGDPMITRKHWSPEYGLVDVATPDNSYYKTRKVGGRD